MAVMDLAFIALLTAAGLFIGMLLLCEIGRSIGRRRLARQPGGPVQGAGPAEAAVFGLLGLLIAFSFSGAASRFEARRHLITAEANAISTAYLRIDLLPGDAQARVRAAFRRYTELRATTYQGDDVAAAEAALAEAAVLQDEIWRAVLSAVRRPDSPAQASMLVVPALNEMFDVMTTRVMATRNHPPLVVFLLLGGLSLVGALMVGYGGAANPDHSWFHSVLFAAILSLTLYVIIDLEFPRLGIIRVADADQVLMDTARNMR